MNNCAIDVLGKSFTLYPNGIVVRGKPSSDEYNEAFNRLKFVENATSWWWGDLASARERDYGSLKELSDNLGVDYNTLRTYQWVVEQYEVSIRIDTLSFIHHRIAAPLRDRLKWLVRAKENNWSPKELKLAILKSKIEAPTFDGAPPIIIKEDCRSWLNKHDPCDLLLTDPPYSTDLDIDIETFVKWLPLALNKVKSTGHAYIFIGAYPCEIRAYLNTLGDNINLTQLLVWEYKNTMGPSPKQEYKNNWQAIIYYHGQEAKPLISPLKTEQYSVHQFSMPNTSNNPYHHKWEKPKGLAERFIRQSTKKGDIVYDPFLGTGTFLIAAAKYGRMSFGCDIDDKMLELAIKRGCIIG